MRPRIAAGLVAAVLALPVRGQTTGAIEGFIVDGRAQVPLPGAVIVASGPALQGETTAVTDAAGRFVLSLLPPGSYTLELQRQGYASFTLEEIAVSADQVTGVQRSMLPLGAPGAAEAQAARPAISLPTTAMGGTISRAQMQLIPYGRDFRSFDQPVLSVPGVASNLSMLGTPGPLYRIDGATVQKTRLLQDFVEEVGVVTGGYPAEYGRTSSGIVNAVTRSGGDVFHGSLFGDFLAGSPAAGDGGLELGGPLKRERLWFYAGIAPASAASQTQWQYIGKLTFRPAADQTLSLESFGDGSRAGSLRYLGRLFDRSLDVEATAAYERSQEVEGRLKLTNRFQLAGHHELRYGADGTRSLWGAFAQDTWHLLDTVFLEEGVRVDREPGATMVMTRIGASWDFTGRGLSKAYAFYGRFERVDQAIGGVQYRVFADAVASVEYAHTGKPYDAVMVALRKPFAQNYLLQASYAYPHAVKLDAAYLYEWTARTSASLGATFHAIENNPWDTKVAARAALTRALSSIYLLTAALDFFSSPAAARLGLRLSF